MIKTPQRVQSLSVAIAVVLLLVYGMYLATHVFHVRSTRRNPRWHGKPVSPRVEKIEEEEDEKAGEVEAVTGNLDPHQLDERRVPPNPWLIVGLLLVATIGTAWNSELLVGAIRPVTVQLGWSQVFIGLVIIPIIGNATEHSSAVYIAIRDRIDLSMAIAAGSSIQVATLVAPLLVLVSLFFPTHLDMVFQPLELVIMGLAAILFALISLDGESSWLAGVQLVALYLIACIVFFFIPG